MGEKLGVWDASESVGLSYVSAGPVMDYDPATGEVVVGLVLRYEPLTGGPPGELKITLDSESVITIVTYLIHAVRVGKMPMEVYNRLLRKEIAELDRNKRSKN